MRTLDLSVPLNEVTPTYEGDPPTKLELVATVATDGYAFTYISVNSHTGTHIDAPAHMLPSPAKTLNEYPIEAFSGRGVYIDAKEKAFDLEMIEQANVQAGDIVLFHTGMSSSYKTSAYYSDYPAIPENVARYLVEKRVKMVGVDMCSIDHEPFDAHKILLANDVLIIENLTGLERLAGKDFIIHALPLYVTADAAPARVIAVLKERP